VIERSGQPVQAATFFFQFRKDKPSRVVGYMYRIRVSKVTSVYEGPQPSSGRGHLSDACLLPVILASYRSVRVPVDLRSAPYVRSGSFLPTAARKAAI